MTQHNKHLLFFCDFMGWLGSFSGDFAWVYPCGFPQPEAQLGWAVISGWPLSHAWQLGLAVAMRDAPFSSVLLSPPSGLGPLPHVEVPEGKSGSCEDLPWTSHTVTSAGFCWPEQVPGQPGVTRVGKLRRFSVGAAAESLLRDMFTKMGRICGHSLQSAPERNQHLLSVNHVPGMCRNGTCMIMVNPHSKPGRKATGQTEAQDDRWPPRAPRT